MKPSPPVTLEDFRGRVALVLKLYPGSETSGHRSKKRNRLVGGGKFSWHLIGLAVDIVLDSMTYRSRKGCVGFARRIGLDAVDETDHIHLETSA